MIAKCIDAFETYNFFYALCVCIGYLLFWIGCFLIAALIIMLLWNWVVPIIWVSAPKISLWTALGLKLLVNCLFPSNTTVKTE